MTCVSPLGLNVDDEGRRAVAAELAQALLGVVGPADGCVAAGSADDREHVRSADDGAHPEDRSVVEAERVQLHAAVGAVVRLESARERRTRSEEVAALLPALRIEEHPGHRPTV